MRPTIGRIVTYRSRTGRYDVPAVVTATQDTLDPAGVEAHERSSGRSGVPSLSSPNHVHLTVFTPGLPGQRADALDFEVESSFGRSENVAGCYQEWDIPLAGSSSDAADIEDEPAPGTWRWPERVS